MARLIGLTGLAGSGKSTAAKALIDHGWVNVKMAGPLKDMLRAIGLTDDHIEGSLKEIPCELLSEMSPRFAMQTLGTEWGRDIMDQDFWVNIAEHRINGKLAQGCDVIVDDIRFQNEADMIRRNGGTVVNICGRGGIVGNHTSEAGIVADFDIRNDGSIERFVNDVLYVLHRTDY